MCIRDSSKPGYASRKLPLRISDRDAVLNVALEKARYALTVRPEPADAKVRLLNAPVPYQPGIPLPPGHYEIEVAREGYQMCIRDRLFADRAVSGRK